MEARKKSYFYNMRLFHNHVKRMLYDKYANNIENLLDLCSGKGGDIDKWLNNNIINVHGYDIDIDSVNEAKSRLKSKLKYKHNNNYNFDVLDLSTNVLPKPQKPQKLYNVVSSMFAFHYFFKSKETFETIITTIQNNLIPGGYFIGCLFDGETVNTKLNNPFLDPTRFYIKQKQTNDYYGDIFGNCINVYIGETVLDKPTDEYLVNFQHFVILMESKGFVLVETSMFSDIFKQCSGNFQLNNVEQELSFLNRYFVFKKTC